MLVTKAGGKLGLRVRDKGLLGVLRNLRHGLGPGATTGIRTWASP